MLPDLIAACPEATAWVDQQIAEHVRNDAFGRIAASVIWSDATGPDGKLLVPIDAYAIAAKINAEPFPLLKGHDPGFPIGKTLAAAAFTNENSRIFIAAVLGFYGGKRLSFRDLGLDSGLSTLSSAPLPDLTEAFWIYIVTDPREVDPKWLEGVIRSAPVRVQQAESSHNAVEPLNELIQVGLPYAILVWNPFIKAFATEAGKDAYGAMRLWLRTLLDKLADRKNPILEIQAHYADCQMSFIFRGTDVARHHAAHDSLPFAAAQAESLVTKMNDGGLPPKLVVYEFHPEDCKWFPSYAELRDGRLITDNNALIAVERLPSGLSLGLVTGDDRPRLPSVR